MATPMRGASADALAALTSSLVDRLQGGADASRIGEDLFSVSSLLRTEASLRRVATDASLEAAAKKSLVDGLLSAKVDPVALELISDAVGRRWTVARDLADALETLSEISAVRSAGAESARLADELFSFSQTLNTSPELRDALGDPARTVADKSALVSGLLTTKALPATVTLAQQALAGTYRTVSSALATYQQVAAEVHGERVATVHVAHPLSDADSRRLSEALSRQYSRPIHLNVLVDPTVIGGIRVEIGDEVIDGTVESRLDDARRKLAG